MLRLAGVILVCALAQVAGAQSVRAQDYSGFYAGISLGASHINSKATQSLFSPLCAAGGGGGGNGCKLQQAAIDSVAPDFDHFGFTGGGQIGYNWRSGIFLFGFEADLNYVDLDRSKTNPVTWVTNNGGQKTVVTTMAFDSSNYVATVRSRLGLIGLHSTLLYVTGGVAFADLSFSNDSVVYNQGGGGPNLPIHATWYGSSSRKVGYALGAGFEFPLMPGVTGRIEYQHLEFDVPEFTAINTTSLGGRFALTNATLNTRPTDLSANIFRFGLNWRLN